MRPESPPGLRALCLGLCVWLQLWSFADPYSPAPGLICSLLMKAHPLSINRTEAMIPSFPHLLFFSSEISVRELPFDLDSSCYSHPHPLTKPSFSLTLFFHPVFPSTIRFRLKLPRFACYYCRMSLIYQDLIKLHWTVMKKEQNREAGIYFGGFLEIVFVCCYCCHAGRHLHWYEVSQDPLCSPSLCCRYLLLLNQRCQKALKLNSTASVNRKCDLSVLKWENTGIMNFEIAELNQCMIYI